MGALICAAELMSPFLILVAVSIPVGRGAAKAILPSVLFGSHIAAALVLLKGLRDLKGLFRSPKDVVNLPRRCKPAKDLVLRREIKLLHHLIKLHPQLQVLTIKLLECNVLLADEEPQILGFVLRLANDCLPSELNSVCIFFLSYQLVMQIIVLLDEPLVFLLQWDESLGV